MKQFIFIAILLASAFFVGKNLNIIKEKLKTLPLKNNKFIIGVALACLLFGVLIGNGGNILKNIPSGIPNIFAPKAPIVKNSQSFILCDFESENDIKKWNTVDSDVTLSDEYVTSGKHSGRFKYSKGGQVSKIAIEKYFYRDPRLGDWRGYKYLLFDIYSTQANSERIILKIRDDNEKTFQKDIFVPSKKKYTAKIYLSELKASVDISKIRQFNLFRWEPKSDVVVYVDNLRLVNDSEEAHSSSADKLISTEKNKE
jgi:hypothetical protein